ncbi:MAG TPA: NAD(P)H-dependent oxidoreductase [Bacteroidales bacterium]|nr:NAD(P)H-dependent oxidoreductase [Bacteroidales bacterium]
MEINLKIILASTRPGRKGPAIAEWIYELAAKRNEFKTELIDLEEVNLPFLDEPKHPRYKDYTKEHTRRWSKIIDAADAFIFVTPEYNHGYPASLKNALDFLFLEWNYKPAGFVSYGGVAGGTRSVQQLKQVITAQKMMPVTEAVHIPFFVKLINSEGRFLPEEGFDTSAGVMLDELAKWAETLRQLRE